MVEIKADFRKTFKDLELLRNTFPAAGKATLIEFAKECAKVGMFSTIIPKRTGNMRSTSRAIIEPNSIIFAVGGIVGNPTRKSVKSKLVDYAIFVNNGTSRQAAQFFMERILSRVATRTDSIYRQTLNSWLKRVERN